HALGDGAVIVTLTPRMLGQDERAHPALPYLLNGLTDGLLPVEVRRKDGKPLQGEVMWQLNRTKDGWLVLLVNNRGVDKTENGMAVVGRLEQFLGCLLGQAVGDGLGAPFEGLPADSLYWGYGPPDDLIVLATKETLQYTDDTQMMIGVAETLAEHGRIIEDA